MKKAWEELLWRIHADVTRAWLVFVQSINAIAMALLGGALIVHQTYPDVLRGLLAGLPPQVGAACLFAFGAIVHWALRRAKKAGE